MKIYEIRQIDDGTTLDFKSNKREANIESRWWSDHENDAEVIEIEFEPTRAGICKLLKRYMSRA